MRVGIRALLCVVVLASVQVPVRAADRSPLAGSWAFSMPRPGWTPAVATGRLVLAQADGKWSGSLTFDVLFNGRTQKLADLVVKGSTFACRLDSTEFDVRFDAKLEKEELAGRCAWKGGGDFRWTATREKDEAIARFEDGLKFDGFLPKGDAEKLGMDGAALDTLLRDASRNDTDWVVVLRDGHVVADRSFGRPRGPIETMSVTKFVVAIAIAQLLEEKKIASLDAPLSTWFPEWTDGNRAKVTLRHVLTHTSGIAHGKNALALNSQKDRVGFVRGARVVAEPGTACEYNNEAVALLSGVVAAAGGRQVDQYLREKLFAPLGIRDFQWTHDGAGSAITYAELSLTARDLARIGQVVVDGGSVGKKQLLAPESIQLLSTPSVAASPGYGLLWMLQRDPPDGEVRGVYHHGSLGQWIVVLPHQRTVAVRLRRGTGGEKPEFEFGAFLERVRAAAN